MISTLCFTNICLVFNVIRTYVEVHSFVTHIYCALHSFYIVVEVFLIVC